LKFHKNPIFKPRFICPASSTSLTEVSKWLGSFYKAIFPTVNNTCPVVLHRLSLVRRFVDDLFVPDVPVFEDFMYLDQDSFGGSIHPKTSCELNCTSRGFSCNFLYLAVNQCPQGISCDIFEKCSQPEYAGIEMIHMPHVQYLNWMVSTVNFTGF
jgi:hypothetical protein